MADEVRNEGARCISGEDRGKAQRKAASTRAETRRQDDSGDMSERNTPATCDARQHERVRFGDRILWMWLRVGGICRR